MHLTWLGLSGLFAFPTIIRLGRVEYKPGQLSGILLLILTLILKVVKLPLTSVRALCLCERSLSYVYLKINKVNWIKESGGCSASAFGKKASFIPSQGRQWNQNGSVNRAWFDFILPHLQISTFLIHIFWKAQPESIPELLLPKCLL